MPLYEFITKSCFENVYVIEARNQEEAAEIVMNNDNPPDFYQKHLGETKESCRLIVDDNPTDIHLSSAHKNIRDRGYE